MHLTSVPRCVAVITMFACVPAAANENLAGDWMLELRSEDAPVVGMLQLEFVDGAWMAYVEGGPVEVEVDGNNIEVAVDSRDLSGFVFYRRLTGTVDGDSMSGAFTIERERSSTEKL